MFWKTATAIAALSVLTPCGALAQESTVNYNTDATSDVTTTNNSVNTNVNTNNNINSGDQTIRGINQNTNVNQNTSSSTNVNTNNVINSGDQTIRNIGTNSSSSTSANTNSNTNFNQSTSTSANTNVNTSTTNSAVTSTSSTNNVNTDNSTSVSTATQNVTSDTTTTAENTNTNNNTSNSTQDVTQRIVSPPPTAMAPTIMSSYSQDVCMTSASGALQTQFFGLSGGKGVRDMNCERMKLGKTLFDMGMRVAAVSLLCQDERVYESMAMAGTPCPYEGLIGDEAAAGWDANPEAVPGYEAPRRPLVRRAGRPR